MTLTGFEATRFGLRISVPVTTMSAPVFTESCGFSVPAAVLGCSVTVSVVCGATCAKAGAAATVEPIISVEASSL